MDAAATSFRGVSATLNKVSHTAVINDDSRESGSMRMLRQDKTVQVLLEFAEPDVRSMAFRDRKVEIYYPKIQTVQEYDLGKFGNLVDQFMLLGFGTPGRELAASYKVRVVGEDAVAEQRTVRIELVPKSSKVLEHLKKAELWISESGGYPIQQKFYQSSGDHTTITYTNVQRNPELDAESVRLKLPKGVKREYPQR